MKHRLLYRLTCCVLVFSAGAASTLACASDDGSEEETPMDGDPPMGTGGIPPRGSGSVFEDLDIEDPEPAEFYFSEVEAPYDDVEGCKAFPSAYPEVHSCSCDNCYEIQMQCDSLEGCREIAECGIAIGCSDAFDCYLAPAPDKTMCVPIIDKWGNTGVSAALSLQLGECTITNGCREAPQ